MERDATVMSGVVDMRPESSPYASPLITIDFADGPPLSVPIRILDRSPKLSAGCGYDMTLHLAHIPSGTGHVLIHYLFTGTYECLKPTGSSTYERDIAEFATSVRVYAVARDYELPDLENLARGEMAMLGARLHITHILDVLKDTHLHPSADDVWLQSYIKSLVKPLMDDPPASLDAPPDSPSQELSVTNILLKVVVELCREKTDSLKHSPTAPVASQDCKERPATNPDLNPGLKRLDDFPTAPPESVPQFEVLTKKQKKDKKKQSKLAVSGHLSGAGGGTESAPKSEESKEWWIDNEGGLLDLEKAGSVTGVQQHGGMPNGHDESKPSAPINSSKDMPQPVFPGGSFFDDSRWVLLQNEVKTQ